MTANTMMIEVFMVQIKILLMKWNQTTLCGEDIKVRRTIKTGKEGIVSWLHLLVFFHSFINTILYLF